MKCWTCGAEATKTRDITSPIMFLGEQVAKAKKADKHQRCYCDKCFDEYIAELKENERLYVLTRKKHMFEMAVRKMESQDFDFEKYQEAIKAVEEYNLEHLDTFDSTYEMIATIILIQHRIRIKPQYKVGRYQIDFYLPDYGVALEIDGERHKAKKKQDSERDAVIRSELCAEVIRISTDLLDMKSAKLVDAIEHVLKYRQSGKIEWRAI